MIDLHTHSLLSDGELLPSELIRRAKVKGYRAIGISDHVDGTNIEKTVLSILNLIGKIDYYEGITVLPGVEITHVPKGLIKEMIRTARELGAYYVVVHGETLSEPVEPGTNMEAILGGADILAHPGLITEEELVMARSKGILIEISARKGHSLANGHVAMGAKKAGASMVINTDSHGPSDLITRDEAFRIALGAGLTTADFAMIEQNAMQFVERIVKERQ